MSDGIEAEPLIPQRYVRRSRSERKKTGRPFKTGKPSRFEPKDYRAWYCRLMANVRDLRLELDISTKALGAAIGMNPTTITKLENGYSRDIRLSTVFRMCQGMGATVSEVCP